MALWGDWSLNPNPDSGDDYGSGDAADTLNPAQSVRVEPVPASGGDVAEVTAQQLLDARGGDSLAYVSTGALPPTSCNASQLNAHST